MAVQSEQLRTPAPADRRKRRQHSDQAVVSADFLYFPGVLVVLPGPSVLQIMRSLAPVSGAVG